jgi:pyridoxamine 5'-phosphate oxidase-like protein
MVTWGAFSEADPSLAQFGVERLHGRVAYLATLRASGAPNVHPVTPIIAQGRLFLFMEPNSPKGHDLRRDARYALHAGVEDNEGGAGEFAISGRAAPVDDPALRADAVAGASYTPQDRYICFELSVDEAAATRYSAGGAERRRWRVG